MRNQSRVGAVLVVLLTIPGTALMAQAERPAPSNGAAAPAAERRTSWGDPDLQGVWSSGPMSDVPFERAPELGTRAVTNEQEFAARVTQNQTRAEEDRVAFVKPGDGIISPPTHWYAAERGSPSTQASLIVDPPDGRLPPLTEDGATRARRWKEAASHPDGPEDLNPYDRCITRGVLGSAFPNIYNSAARIFQTPTEVAIHFEMIHETRIIPIDGRPHAPAAIRSYMGDPRGHWEGGTLVVETTNFNGRTGSYARNGDGNPTSEQLRLVERFTLTADSTLQYEVRVDDVATYTAPWTVAFPMTRADTYTIFEYACHEGNYALANILSGVRAAERGPDR